MLIRAMQTQDLPVVHENEAAAFPLPWSLQQLADCLTAHYQCLVIEKDEKVIGHAIGYLVVNEYHLLNICIHPNEQRQGYAEQLMFYITEQAKQSGVDVMWLEVRESNERARALYKKLEFIEFDRRKKYYPTQSGHEDAIILVRYLH